MANENGRSIWGHVRDGTLLLGIIAGGGFGYTNSGQLSTFGTQLSGLNAQMLAFNAQIAHVSATQEAHLANHPNVELQRQINDLTGEIRQMKRDMRELERRRFEEGP